MQQGVLQLVPELRDLPWRATRDPWAVLVSEVMLQQTQVQRVVEAWERFLTRFPDAEACAAAPVAAVIEAWSGLGYNRRAVALHAAATAVAQRFGGIVPDDLSQLCSLPGIGPYTGRAVLAFAYEHDVAVVDTNVGRVLCRAVAGRPLDPWPRAAQQVADLLVPAGRAWAWNQAIVEAGATICTSRAPRCDRCPLARGCSWAAGGKPQPDPWQTRSRQGVFVGSDRQGRGRLIAALRRGPLGADALAGAAGWADDPERARRVAETLVADNLAVWRSGQLSLP